MNGEPRYALGGARLGPWGTTRAEERRYGYPPPRRLGSRERIAQLERRVQLLEALLLEATPAAAPAIRDDELAPVPSEVALMPNGRIRLAWRS
jgi:hypothetical protein